MLEPIVKTIEVTCSQQRAFDIFVDINSWWPLDKRSMSMKNGGYGSSWGLLFEEAYRAKCAAVR